MFVPPEYQRQFIWGATVDREASSRMDRKHHIAVLGLRLRRVAYSRDNSVGIHPMDITLPCTPLVDS
jgi:hypothetical protein